MPLPLLYSRARNSDMEHTRRTAALHIGVVSPCTRLSTKVGERFNKGAPAACCGGASICPGEPAAAVTGYMVDVLWSASRACSKPAS